MHRVFVTDAGGKPLNVLTQSDLLKWAVQKTEERLRDTALPAESLMTKKEGVLTVRDTEVAIDAFFALESAHVAGAPVLDADGRLVGSLSTSDLKQARAIVFLFFSREMC